MIRRRAEAAGIRAPIGNHTFRATGITAYLSNGGLLGHCNLYRALGAARRLRAGRYAQSSLPRPRGTSLAGGELWAISCAANAAADATISSRLQRNSPPSAHMRCMITASWRATATIARRRPRRLAMAIPQAFSADHWATRVNRACAARNNASRASRSPLLLIAPLRSISPEAYLRGVKPRCAPTSRDRAKRAGSSMAVAKS